MLGLIGLLLAGSAYGQQAPWPMFRNNAQRTGATTLIGPVTPEVEWRFDLGGYAYSSPAIGADGVIYVGSADSVYAISPSGVRRWARAVEVGGYAISSPLVTGDGTVFIGSRDGALYVIRGGNDTPGVIPVAIGTEIWTSPLPTAGSNEVVIGGFDGVVYQIERANTTYRQRTLFTTTSATDDVEIIASPALGEDGVLYIGTLGRRLYAVRPNGQAVWAQPFEAADEIFATPVVVQDRQGRDRAVIVADRAGFVYAVDPGTGTELWRYAAGGDVVASPALGNGAVYVIALGGEFVEPSEATGTEQWTLVALDAATGTARWTHAAAGQVISSPALDGEGNLYFGSTENVLYSFASDGTPRWERLLDSSIGSSPAIGPDETLYVVTEGTQSTAGSLYAFRSARYRVEPDVTVGREGTEIIVEATGDEPPSAAVLFARRGGERTYQQIEMNPSEANAFRAAIPGGLVTARGVEYYVRLTFGEVDVTFPSTNPEAEPATLRVQVPSAEAEGVFPAKRYRMVSVPLQAEDPGLATVFAAYGPYERSQWRLVRWTGSRYRELPELERTATPGTAFFLITQWGTPFTIGPATSVDTARPYVLTLRPGWNQIATPFAFPVAWRDVGRNPAAVALGNVAVWRDGWVQNPAMIDSLRLMPWEGVLVYNASSANTTLSIPARATGGDEPILSKRPTDRLPHDRFMLGLHASADGHGADTQNWVGFVDALGDEMVGDVLEAPPVEPGVRLSIVEGSRAYARRVTTLAEAEGSGGARWAVRVQSEARLVDLQFVPLGTLPEGFGMYVVDPETRRLLPTVHHRLELALGADGQRELEVVIGTEAYLRARHPEATDLPSASGLGASYPDPFLGATTIPYAVRDAGEARVEVFNLLGQRVARLAAGPHEAGHHTLVWDGRDADGRRLASGVYLVRLTAGATKATRRIVILR